MAKRKGGKFIQAATEEMDRKGTRGKFGKATKKKIARGKAKGGKAEKEAVFADNMKRIAEKRDGKRKAKRSTKKATRRKAKRGGKRR